jgi:hypothetical protein
MSRWQRPIAACSLVLAAAALGGCGSSGGTKQVSAQAYASALCTAVGPFEREIYTHAGALTDLGSVAPAAGKATLIQFLVGTAADSEHADLAMRGAGVPDVAEGKQISGALVAMFSRLTSSLSAAESSAEALPTTTESAFKTAAEALSDSVRTSVGDAGAGLQGLKSSALEHAANASPACHSLG